MGYRLGVIRAASRSSPLYAQEPTLCQERVRRLRFSFDVRTAPRLHSSDDGLFLTTSTLRRLEQDVQHLAIHAHSISADSFEHNWPQSSSRVPTVEGECISQLR
jgi:hypothetical protein